MFLELDGEGPRYAQLTRAMKTAILDGRLVAGAKVPPTRELAEEIGLSRTTVLAAYEQLHAEGFIEGKVGSGSYVATLQDAPSKPPPVAVERRPSRYMQRLDGVDGFWLGQRRTLPRYSLQYGVPLTNPALTSAWSRELARAARYTDPDYPHMQGLPALRRAVCDYLARRRGVRAEPDDVLIVNGTQQALSLAARVLLDEGDTAVLENPSYFGARRVLVAHGAHIEAVRTDRDGLVCAELPAAGARLLYVTPSHQFPGGAVMSLQRRLDLLRYAREHDGWVVEDDYDGEFRYDVHPLAALHALDRYGRVIYMGTFSKSVFPALRLGYVVVPTALHDAFIATKAINDMGSSGIEQAALAGFIGNGGFERHLKQMAKTLKARRAVLLEGLLAHAGGRIDVDESHAGMHLVVWLRHLDHAQCDALIERAGELGLGLYPIAPHYIGPPPSRPGLLIGYAGIPIGDLPEALRLFGQCLDEFCPECLKSLNSRGRGNDDMGGSGLG